MLSGLPKLLKRIVFSATYIAVVTKVSLTRNQAYSTVKTPFGSIFRTSGRTWPFKQSVFLLSPEGALNACPGQ